MNVDPWKEVLDFILRRERGFSDDRDDPGGRTNMGITQHALEVAHHSGWGAVLPIDVRLLSKADAGMIYEHNYWRAASCDNLTWPLALFHFDAAVNCGVGQAGRFLRTSRGGPPEYLAARRQFYHDLVAKRPRLQKFLKGWEKRCDALAEYL